MEIGNIKDSYDFYHPINHTGYLIDKYRGRIIQDPDKDLELEVESIYDLKFEDLDFEDQRLALKVGWAWGVTDNKDIDKSKKFKAYLFRPKQFRFFWCPSKYPAYIGGMGSGKSHIICLRGIYTSLMYPGTHGLLMRATYPQLMDTTVETFFKICHYFGWENGKHYNHHISRKIIELYVGKKVSQVYYRPAKNEGSSVQDIIQDLQSFEIDWGGIDEVVGVDEIIATTVMLRVGRWGVVTKREDRKMMVAGNPPSEGTWIHKRWYEKKFVNDNPIKDPDDHAVFVSSSYENKRNLPKDNVEALESLEDYKRRSFLEGRLGFAPPDGEPIFKDFNYALYVSDKPLEYNPKLPLITGWDIGPTAVNKAFIVGQLDSRGTLNVLGELMVTDPGVSKLGELVIRRMDEWFGAKLTNRNFCDPVGFDISQTDGLSPAMILRKMGIDLQKGEETFQLRFEAVTQTMNRLIDGVPGMRIDGTRCRKLTEGLMGGYRYRIVDLPNQRFSKEPIKDIYSHVQDALQYLCSRLPFVRLKQRDESQSVRRHRDQALRNKRQRLLGKAVGY